MSKRVTYFILSMCIALSVSLSLFNFTTIILLKNPDYVASKLTEYAPQVRDELVEEINQKVQSDVVPNEVLFDAIDDEMENIINTSANNFVVRNPNDFSGYEELYNTMFRACDEYLEKSGIDADTDEISHICSLAVDCVNTRLSSADTENTKLFEFTQSTVIFVLSIAFAVLFAASIFALDFLNKGRHRKNSYIGMGIVTAGYIEAVLPLFVCRIGLIEREDFCGFAPFNSGLYSAVWGIMQLQALYGIILIFVGVLVLALNYRYFARKNKHAKRENELHKTSRNEYIDKYNDANPQQELSNGDREVIDVDF